MGGWIEFGPTMDVVLCEVFVDYQCAFEHPSSVTAAPRSVSFQWCRLHCVAVSPPSGAFMSAPLLELQLHDAVCSVFAVLATPER